MSDSLDASAEGDSRQNLLFLYDAAKDGDTPQYPDQRPAIVSRLIMIGQHLSVSLVFKDTSTASLPLSQSVFLYHKSEKFRVEVE